MPAPKDPEKLLLWKQRLSDSHKGLGKGVPKSAEHRIKTGLANKGKTRSLEARRNISIAHLGIKQTPEQIEKRIAPLRGRQRSQEIREKIRKSHLGVECSEEHKQAMRLGKQRQWAGHINTDPRGDKKYDEWRSSVLLRDKRTCQRCFKVGGRLTAHHIKSWKDYPELRYDVNNGKTLCKHPCHRDEHRHVKQQQGISKSGW